MAIKLQWILMLLACVLLTAAPANISGKWEVSYDGPPRTGPKTIGSMLLDLHVDGKVVTGMVQIGIWPGEAPIADGRIDGDRITFTATGHLS